MLSTTFPFLGVIVLGVDIGLLKQVNGGQGEVIWIRKEVIVAEYISVIYQ